MMGLQDAPQFLALGSLLMLTFAWTVRECCYLPPAHLCDLEAEKKAIALLRELLSTREREQLAERGYLAVPSPGVADRTYRIPARPGKVDVYEAGTLAMRVCVEPLSRLPAADIVLAHKLMIEGSEQEYLRTANIQWMRCG